MPSEKFLKAQVGLQTAHGAAVTPTIQWPGTANAEDVRTRYEAPYDAGAWTPTTIICDTAYLTRLVTAGLGFYEILPVYLNAGLEDVAPTGAGPYTHTYIISPAAVAVPMPTTWLVGAVGTNLGATGPAIKLKDLYLSDLTLTGNMNDKTINHSGTWFGTTFDDNAGAGYAFAAVGLPATLHSMRFLHGALNIDDAGTTGGAFTTMTAFTCTLMDWSWKLITGIAPRYCGDSASLSMAGIKYTTPAITMDIAARLSNTYYALMVAKYTAAAYQELQLIVTDGTDTLTINMTGRWTAMQALRRADNEVVMQGTFTCQTPHTQVTTPHYCVITNVSTQNWT